MTRLFVSVLAGILVFELAGAAQAQVAAGDPNESGSAYGGYFYGNQPFGGFGLQYAQPIANGGVIMDRYGMLYVAAPAPTPNHKFVTARAPVQPRGRQSRTETKRVQAQPKYQMPTGSLYWPGANSGILYSPGMRYQTYGGGYAQSPYGDVDHSLMYKGWELGY